MKKHDKKPKPQTKGKGGKGGKGGSKGGRSTITSAAATKRPSTIDNKKSGMNVIVVIDLVVRVFTSTLCIL